MWVIVSHCTRVTVINRKLLCALGGGVCCVRIENTAAASNGTRENTPHSRSPALASSAHSYGLKVPVGCVMMWCDSGVFMWAARVVLQRLTLRVVSLLLRLRWAVAATGSVDGHGSDGSFYYFILRGRSEIFGNEKKLWIVKIIIFNGGKKICINVAVPSPFWWRLYSSHAYKYIHKKKINRPNISRDYSFLAIMFFLNFLHRFVGCCCCCCTHCYS